MQGRRNSFRRCWSPTTTGPGALGSSSFQLQRPDFLFWQLSLATPSNLSAVCILKTRLLGVLPPAKREANVG